MARATSSTMIPGSDLYSYVEASWSEGKDECYLNAQGGVTSGFYWDLTCTSVLKWWENGVGHDLDSGSGHYGGYSDMQLVSAPETFTRQASDRTITVECYSTCTGGSGSATLPFTVPHKAGQITGLTATRASDNQVNLSWTMPSAVSDGVGIEVSIDGGAWSQIDFIGVATSYQYNNASAGHSYQFRVWAAYKANVGAASNVVTVTMTPSAPTAISTSAIQGSTNVAVTLENPSTISTGIKWQYSTDGASWLPSTPNAVSGSPVTSFTATVSGSVYIRVCNTNSLGDSAWIVSEKVTTICPPAAPTLTSPSNVWNTADGGVVFSWRHNPLDGSSQTAYELRYARNGGAWTTLSGTTDQTHTVAISSFTVGDSVSWQVRTKGADANYSDWAQAQAFSVYSPPTVTITSPGATITSMPIGVNATYSDMAGFTCQAATVSLQKDGRTLFSESATINGSTITVSITTDEFLPTNGESYTVVVTARSSSSLQTSANATFTVDFVPPRAADLNITNDPDTGYASLLVQGVPSESASGTSPDPLDLDTEEGEYIQGVTVEGAAVRDTANNVVLTTTGAGTPWTVYKSGYNINASGVEGTSANFSILSQPATAGERVTFGFVPDTTTAVNNRLHAYSNGSWMEQIDVILSDSKSTYTFNIIVPSGCDELRFSTRKAATVDPLFPPLDISTNADTYANIVSRTWLAGIGDTHDEYVDGVITRRIGCRAYQSDDESDPDVLTDGSVLTYYVLGTPVEVAAAPLDYKKLEVPDTFTLNASTPSDFTVRYGLGSVGYESVSVARVNPDGTITPLLTDGQDGAGIVDRYAPLNTEYQYAVTTKASTQAVYTNYVSNEIVTDLWFAYWGDNIASAKWNPDNGGIQLSRPQKTRVYYAGRKDPVSYDGHAVALTETPSWMFIEKDETAPFVQLIEDGGRGVYKSCDGWVYHADFDLTLTPKYTAIGYYGGIGLSVTRIAGDRL